MKDEINTTQAIPDAYELVSLLKSGQYPRSLLENNDPDVVDPDSVIEAFCRIVQKEDHYSFLSQ